MPTNLTLKSVPDEVYERLKQSATVNRRSLNSEIIARLEAQVMIRRATAQDHLIAIRTIRDRLPKVAFDHADIDGFKREGRS
jgi:antitoxin FitA